MSQTHFGFEKVDEREKAGKVAGVFHSVASKYDVMNDLMSGGLHRVWKMFTIAQAAVRPGYKVLDIAGGTGDLAKAFARQAGPTGEVWLTDINESMLRVGRDRLLDVRRRAHSLSRCLLRRRDSGIRLAQHDAQGSRAR
jgi:demethylmenaquinone methyltransferase/2-methoxy-6-polyprenyl-1,4-benzoquinol methylase